MTDKLRDTCQWFLTADGYNSREQIAGDGATDREIANEMVEAWSTDTNPISPTEATSVIHTLRADLGWLAEYLPAVYGDT